MVRLLEFLREVDSSERYAFVAADRRKVAQQAFDRGLECILKCQIQVDGKFDGPGAPSTTRRIIARGPVAVTNWSV